MTMVDATSSGICSARTGGNRARAVLLHWAMTSPIHDGAMTVPPTKFATIREGRMDSGGAEPTLQTRLVAERLLAGSDAALSQADVGSETYRTLLQTMEEGVAEAALRASEARHRALFETMGQGYVDLELVRDAQGRAVDQRYLEVNPAFERVFGIPVAEATGRRASEVLPGLEPWWHDTFDAIAKRGAPERIEHEVASLGRWFEVFVYPCGGDRLTVLYEDITPRKRAEDRLRASEERFRALAIAGADTLYRMSPDWSEMWQLDGRGFLANTPLASEAWLTRYIHPDDQPRVLDAIAAAIRERRTFALEHRVVRADGSLGWVFSRAVPLFDASGAITEWIGAAMDVTARKESEAALQSSEERFRSLFAASSAPFLLLAADTPRFTIIDVNKAYLEATMTTREQLLGRGVFEMFPDNPGDPGMTGVSQLRASFEDALASKRPAALPRLKYDVARPDGSFAERWWDPINTPMLDAAGNVSALIHHATDVTHIVRAEKSLRESEERKAFLLKLSDALRPLGDPAEIKRMASRLVCEQLGVNRAFFSDADGDYWLFEKGYDVQGVEPLPEGRYPMASYGQWVIDTFRAGQPHIMRDVRTEGRYKPSERVAYEALQMIGTAGVPLIRGGALVAVLGVHTAEPRDWTERDIVFITETAERTWDAVERARAETALLESEARYRVLVENVRDYAIFLLDANGIITEWTAGAERVQGYTADEVVGRDLAMFFTPEDVAAGKRDQELAEAAATGRAEREGWRVRKDGERFWVNEIATAVHDADGTLVGFTKISRDLTDRRLAEQAAEVARTHVVRDTLRRQLVQAEEEERRRLSRELHDELGQHLAALGLGLQALSDIAPAGSEVDGRATALRALTNTMGRELHDIALRLRPKALDDFGLEPALAAYVEAWSRQTGIRADVHARIDAPRLPEAVESALYRIVQEALTNVAKHSGATCVSVVVERNDGQVHAIVEDDGRGFDFLVVRERGTTADTLLPGLGLLGIQERVTLLGGTMEVESEPSGGTTLFARLPVDGQRRGGHGQAGRVVEWLR